jgi:hypothetical protein
MRVGAVRFPQEPEEGPSARNTFSVIPSGYIPTGEFADFLGHFNHH